MIPICETPRDGFHFVGRWYNVKGKRGRLSPLAFLVMPC